MTYQQIILAKYSYYLKGDIELALENLLTLKSKFSQFQLSQLSALIDQEIESMEAQTNKWSQLSLFFKEWLIQSKFSNYLEESLKLIEIDQ